MAAAASSGYGLTEPGLESLLRLLVPQSEASEEEEKLRAGIILHQASSGLLIAEHIDTTVLSEEESDRLRALQVLQAVFHGKEKSLQLLPAGVPAPAPLQAATRVTQLERAPAAAGQGGSAVHELQVRFGRLPKPVRLLEAADSSEVTERYKSLGVDDPFGAKAWPSAYLVSEQLLRAGLQGRSVLELGCGTGLVSIAALLGGARPVLATDRARPNVDRALESACLNGVELLGDVFDVTTEDPLPQVSSLSTKHFDFVVFSDVLYWPAEAVAFGRRAAEAYVAGSVVVVADPGRRRDDFLSALRLELEARLAGTGEALPNLQPQPTCFPEHVFEWVSEEVRTASSMFCKDPFLLVLLPPQRQASGLLDRPQCFEAVD